MGRPALGVKPTLIYLPVGMAERIDAVAGKNRRSVYIRAAVEEKLARDEALSLAKTGKARRPKPTG